MKIEIVYGNGIYPPGTETAGKQNIGGRRIWCRINEGSWKLVGIHCRSMMQLTSMIAKFLQ